MGENCLVLEKVRYEEVKSLAPTLHFPKFPFPSLSVDIPSIVSLPLPFLTFPINSISTSLPFLLFLPSFSLPYFPCPFCSSPITFFVFPSQPSCFPRYLHLSLPTFPFPTYQLSTFLLPYLYPFLPLPFPTSLLPFILPVPS